MKMMMKPSDPLIGLQLSSYRLEQLLGRGGMGSVYYGWDVRLQRPVAVKVMDTRYQAETGYAARFVQEARALAGLRHANIVQVYTAGEQEGLHYFVMEYIRGLDLARILRIYQQRSEVSQAGDVVSIGRAVANALDEAHRRGIIHRDVKPSNILIAAYGRVMLADFGLAMDMAQGSSGDAFGSPRYIAPEQARSSANAVPQSDLYSLGVMLYEMLAGRTPYDDPSPTSLALQHIGEAPPPPRRFNPRLNAATEAVLLRALEKDPARRYPSGAALMEALETAMAEPSASGPPAESEGGPPTASTPVDELVAQALAGPSAQAGLPAAGMPAAGLAGAAAQPGYPPAGQRAPAGVQAGASRSVTPVYAPQAAPGLAAPGLMRPQAAPPPLTMLPKEPAGDPLRIWAIGCGVVIALTLLGLALEVSFLWQRGQASAAQAESTRSALRLTLQAGDGPGTRRPGSVPSGSPAAGLAPGFPGTQQPAPGNTPGSPVTPGRPVTPVSGVSPGALVGGLQLFYDDTSFYALNASSQDRPASSLAFERLGQGGFPLNRFDGRLWAQFYATFRHGSCLVVELAGDRQHLDPPECRDRRLVTRTPAASQPYIFWTSQSGSDSFRVLWNNQEAGRCAIAAGRCALDLP